MLDQRDNGRYEAWLEDPNPARSVSMRYALSSFSTHPAVPFEENEMPVLVINPLRDKMVRPEYTRNAYERMGGPKSYAEIDAGHWSMLPEFSEAWADEAGAWMKELLS